jgi:tRNA(fMet)-specific endonuclease VapC
MKVLLDTNAYVKLAKGHPPLADVLERADEVLFSTVVLGELRGGFRLGTRQHQNESLLRDFLDNEATAILGVSEDVADRYAELYAELRRRGTPVPANDLWIAATALEAGARLVTYDVHFGAVPGVTTLSP